MKISVVIPCRNEADTIERCLLSIKNNTLQPDEIIVVDGMSTDKTREIVGKFKDVRLIINTNKVTPYGLNQGILTAYGDIIIRMDAHSVYDKNYIALSVASLEKATNVGGKVIPTIQNDTIQNWSIVKCLKSPFGSFSDFRKCGDEMKYTDTAFGGCFKRHLLWEIGFYNTNLVRSQDMEFCQRIVKNGGKILYNPLIVSYYFPKDTLWKFFKHNIKDGIWATYPLKFGIKFKLRHYIPLLFVLTLPISIIPYLLVNLYFSIKGRNPLLPIAFFCRHFGYGLGSLIGLIKCI